MAPPKEDTVITITIPSIGTGGVVFVKRGEVGKLLTYTHETMGDAAAMVGAAMNAIDHVVANPPPVIPDRPTAQEVKPPAPGETPQKKKKGKAAPAPAAAAPTTAKATPPPPAAPEKPAQLSLF